MREMRPQITFVVVIRSVSDPDHFANHHWMFLPTLLSDFLPCLPTCLLLDSLSTSMPLCVSFYFSLLYSRAGKVKDEQGRDPKLS